jgi:Poly(3-hydroxyalkanoate) synthetase
VTRFVGTEHRGLCVAAEAVRRSPAGPEQLRRLLTAEVGHTESEVCYRENKLELRRYEPAERRHRTPILVVYALINRPWILDLQPDRSVVRRLLEAGYVVYLIDWGEPSRLDRSLTMVDYVTRYTDNCVEAARADAGADTVHLLGYCMGGTMAVTYAATNPGQVRTLTLLTTPVAFGGRGGVLELWASQVDPEAVVGALGNVPAELLAATFAMMDPVENCVGKYVRLCENAEDDSFVENFARVERWIWNGVDVAAGVYREFVDDLYKGDMLLRSEYQLGDEAVDLGDIGMPVQQVVGEHDQIVPPASSRPLNDAVGSDDRRLVEFPAGHVGVSVSSAAHDRLWPDVRAWIADR